MKKLKSMLFLLLAVIAIAGMNPCTAEAAKKKPVAVTANNAKISKNKFSLTATGYSQLKVKSGKKNITKKVRYTSSNKKIATINKRGNIYAKKVGKCTISVKYGKTVKKLKLTVTKPYIEISTCNSKYKDEIVIEGLNNGGMACFDIGYKNSGEKKIRWENGECDAKLTSSDPSIATVTKWGLVQPKRYGKCYIKGTYKGIVIKIPVTVKQAAYEKEAENKKKAPEQVKKPAAPKHTHNWFAHTSTEEVWVSDGRYTTVADYEEKTVPTYLCDCGEFIRGREEINAHRDAHCEAGETEYNGIEGSEIMKVQVGTHQEEVGHFEEVTKTLYWTCTCGAKKGN